MFDFGIVTSWLDKLLGSVMPGWLATSIECVIVMVALLLAYSVIAMFYIFYERKVCGWIQCRLGPMRVGPWGTIQVFADVIKILTKEIITLWHTDKFLFFLAPFLVIIASMVMFACLPWGNGLQIIDFNVGVFFIVAVSSLGVLGILLAGWSSNSKYTLIGAMRSGAQMISYELSVGISILTIVCLAGTMSVTGIVEAQADGWFLFKGHIPAIIAFLVFLVAGRRVFFRVQREHFFYGGNIRFFKRFELRFAVKRLEFVYVIPLSAELFTLKFGNFRGGIDVIRVSVFQARQHGHEIGLLLLGHAPLVGQLMGHRGGEQAGRKVHIHIGLRRKGEEKAGEIQIAHDPGQGKGLGLHPWAVQAGKILRHRVEYLRRLLQDRRPIRRIQAVLVPCHLFGIFVGQTGEILRHRRQLLHRDLPRFQPAFGLKIVPIVVDAPQKAESGVDQQQER